ncbi:hypothetical protein [Meridianimarinicoccus aquatilis]|uniref:DUF502 domain-containing protein n=1 Tax=Meridianimarinicoccus aquatilis TaxID=2552766 RepID=A0A4R6ATF0_9RHOB|nr:hypothetical protein [Fluviibacterium aquatile]TDL87861.1 hypothetical protein E2L05_10340 [Fluviibacterium aquatile]
MIRTTLIGGVLFLIPVVFVLYFLGYAYKLSSAFATKLAQFMPVDTVGELAVVNILAVLLIVLVCFVAGLAAHLPYLTRHVEKIEAILVELFPAFTIAKSMASGVTGQDDQNALLKTVLIAFDDHEALGFEIERTETRVIVFLPGAPAAWSGQAVAVPIDRVTRLNLPVHQVTGLLRKLGRGTHAAILRGQEKQMTK